MKALKYNVTVQIDAVHSWSKHNIQEVWVPSCKACFNEEGHVFKRENPRVPIEQCEEIFVAPVLCETIEKYLSKKSQMKNFCDEIFLTTEK